MSFKIQKGVVRGLARKTARQEELEDTKGVIRGRKPKKDRQEELKDTK